MAKGAMQLGLAPNGVAVGLWAAIYLSGLSGVGACSTSYRGTYTERANADADSRDGAESSEGGVAVSAGIDSGANADAELCRPSSVAAFHPPAFVPSRRSPACSGLDGDGGLVQLYGDACIGPASTYSSCSAFAVPHDPAAEACYRCLVTMENPDASEYGAVVIATVPLINYAGCIQVLDSTDSGTACAQTITAAATCAEYACKWTCPVTDQASSLAYRACWNEATSGGCAGYWLRAEACIAAEQGDGGTPIAAICFQGSRPAQDDYTALARYLCTGN